MPRKQTLRLKTRARLLAEEADNAAVASMTPRHPAFDLKATLRLLYERSTLTVREIARLAGISERMLYKYAEQDRWTDRETRSRQQADALALLDPEEAKRIAARTREAVRLSDEAAARAVEQARAHRRHKRADQNFERAVRVYEMLAAALAELMRAATSARRYDDAVTPVRVGLLDLILRQMQMAFDAAGETSCAASD